MRILNTIIFSLLLPIGVMAQEVKVLSFKSTPMDLSASTHPRYDINNDAGALVKVLLAEPNVKFEGDIIGTPEYKNTEYWVYMTAGTKFLKIKAPNAIPIQVSFSDYSLSSAQSKMTYELVLSRSGRAQKQSLTISFSPSSAIVLIDGKKYPSNDGKVVAMFPVGKHDFIVAADGYESYEGAIVLRETAPGSVEANLIKSADIEKLAVPQNGNVNTPNNTASSITQPVNNTNPANSQYILDKVAEAKRLYYNREFTAAYKCFMTAAEAGNAEAQLEIGAYYEFGICVTQNYAEAVKWFRKAAEQGNAEAQYRLGSCYNFGNGVKDYTEAINWYRKAAEQGHYVAQYYLGNCYYNGNGVKNYAEAVKWYRKAAEQGAACSQYQLGCCYELGHGVTKDQNEALKWYMKAAEQDFEDAKKKVETYPNW